MGCSNHTGQSCYLFLEGRAQHYDAFSLSLFLIFSFFSLLAVSFSFNKPPAASRADLDFVQCQPEKGRKENEGKRERERKKKNWRSRREKWTPLGPVECTERVNANGCMSFLIPGSEKSFTASLCVRDGTAVFALSFSTSLSSLLFRPLHLPSDRVKKRMQRDRSNFAHGVILWVKVTLLTLFKSALIYLQDSTQILIHPADLIFFSTDDWMDW